MSSDVSVVAVIGEFMVIVLNIASEVEVIGREVQISIIHLNTSFYIRSTIYPLVICASSLR